MSSDTEHVCMPPPIRLDLRKGIDSLTYRGRPILTRLHLDDIPMLDIECAHLGITRSHFMRWATLHLARELHFRRTGVRRDVVL